MEKSKEQFLLQFLKNTAFDGWGEGNFHKTAKQLNFENNFEDILFSGGVEELTLYFAELVQNKFKLNAENIVATKEKLQVKAKKLMIEKIRLYISEIGSLEGFKAFVSYFFKPASIFTGAKGVYNFASESWYLLNDKSTDFSYYTKRISFSGIYAKAVIYAVNDTSENLQHTELFIERKIDDLMKLNKIKFKIRDLTDRMGFNKFKI
jgi:ubiquinone biosynthesis protein COQ9